MLFLKSWLLDYIDLKDINNQKLADILSSKSGEVEEVIEINDYFKNLAVIGKITNLRKHPSADRLNIFDVFLGNQSVQIISAAPNVYEGMICPVALVGCRLAGMTISERQMRGESSFGMCLGKSELMLETGMSEGLWDLSKDIENSENCLGKSVCEVFPNLFPGETVFDIKYLADRYSSCSNYLGLAIEIAFCLNEVERLTDKAKQVLDFENYLPKLIQEVKEISKNKSELKLNFQDKTDYTNIFGLFHLKLENKFELPHKIIKRMFLSEQNILFSVADLSNYLLKDIGQPSHFFNLDKVLKLNSDQKELNWEIKKLEKPVNFKGLGQLKNHNLPTSVEILESQNQILSLPAVSGSEITKTEFSDLEVLIEVANFPAEMVAKASFKLGYRSDGARVWSSGVNPALQLLWISFLLQLMDECNLKYDFSTVGFWFKNLGNIDFCDFTEENIYHTTKINFDKQYLAKRLDNQDLEFWNDKIENSLNLLAKTSDNQFLTNYFYGNQENQEDLLFDIARLYGLNNLENTYLKNELKSVENQESNLIYELKNLATEYGFYEVLNRPFLKPNQLLKNLLEIDEWQALEALSSQRQEENFLQDSLLSNLLSLLGKNLNLGLKKPAIFELQKIYKLKPNLSEEIYLDMTFEADNPYIFTSLIYELNRKLDGNLDFDTDQKYQKIGNSTIYNLVTKNISTHQGSYSTDNLTKRDIEIENTLNSQKELKSSIYLVEINNKIKKQFNISISKKIWYGSILVSPFWKFEKYKFYPDNTNFSRIKRSYSLIIDKSKTWQNIKNSLISEDKNLQIYLNPQERFNNDSNTDILNFEVEFFSYEKTLESEEIINWEEKFIKKIGKIR
jgi:phenylalanyl-tRNA synthetase beta chain